MDLEALRFLYLRRAVGTVLQTVGIRVADRFGRAVGRAVHSLNTPGRWRAEARLAAWMEASPDAPRVQALAAGMYEQCGRFWVEVLYIRRLLRHGSWRRFVEVENERSLRMLSGARRGCLVTTACLGNVGVLACALGRLFHPIHVIVDALAHPFLRAWQQDLFRQPGVKIVERSGSAGAIPRLLESGQAVLIIAETERRRGSAVEVDFLGRSVRLYPTLGRLAAWYDVPVVVVSCLRCDEPFRFVVRLHGIIRREMCEGDDAVIRETMARLESAVADHPAQYLWSLPTLGAIRARNERQAFGRRTPRQPQASGLKPQAYAYGNLIGVVPQ